MVTKPETHMKGRSGSNTYSRQSLQIRMACSVAFVLHYFQHQTTLSFCSLPYLNQNNDNHHMKTVVCSTLPRLSNRRRRNWKLAWAIQALFCPGTYLNQPC